MGIEPAKADAERSFLRVQNLRHVNDQAHFALACCTGNLELIDNLKSSDVSILRDSIDLTTYATSVSGSIQSINVFIPRIRNTIELVGYTLTLHNQMETAKVDEALRDITEEMKIMTMDTVDDSSTVKIVTLVSTFYLPGSFVGVSGAMSHKIFESQQTNVLYRRFLV